MEMQVKNNQQRTRRWLSYFLVTCLLLSLVSGIVLTTRNVYGQDPDTVVNENSSDDEAAVSDKETVDAEENSVDEITVDNAETPSDTPRSSDEAADTVTADKAGTDTLNEDNPPASTENDVIIGDIQNNKNVKIQPGNKSVDNPYPMIMTDSEVATLDKPLTLVYRLFYLDDEGKEKFKLVKDRSLDITMPSNVTKLEIYQFIKPDLWPFASRTNYWAFSAGGIYANYVPEGETSLNLTEHVEMENRSMEWNGKPYTDAFEIDNGSATDIAIAFHNLTATQYLLTTFTFDTPNDLAHIFTRAGLKYTSSASPAGTARGFFEAHRYADTLFHYVDDFTYRRAHNMAITSPLPERSHEHSDIFSNEAFTPLDLSEIAESQISTGAFFYNDNGYAWDTKYSLVKPEEIEGPDDIKKVGVLRAHYALTNVDGSDKFKLSDLEKKTIKGYVYTDNDVDKPIYLEDGRVDLFNRGNWYNTLGYVDGELKTRKHYYLTYRPVPRNITISKTDADNGTALAGAKFSLFYIPAEGADPVLVKDGLVSDENGKIALSKSDMNYSDLADLVKATNADISLEKNILTVGEDTYLFPGNYLLQETAAPAGYDKASDIKITVEPNTEESDEPMVVAVTNRKTPPSSETTTTSSTTNGTTTSVSTTSTSATTSTNATTTPTTTTTSTTATNSKPTVLTTTTSTTAPSTQPTVSSTPSQTSKKGSLPKTGENDIAVFCAIGLLFIATVIGIYRYKKES